MADEIDLLSQAVHAQFASSSDLVAGISGGLWTGEIPEGTTPPYAWLDLTNTNISPIFEDFFEHSTFAVHIYAIGAAQAEQLGSLFRTAFDWQELPFSSDASCIWLKPRRYRLVPERARWKDGTLMFRAVIVYDVLVQRSLPD